MAKVNGLGFGHEIKNLTKLRETLLRLLTNENIQYFSSNINPMKLIATICAILVCLGAFAQKPPIKFGDVPVEDLEMTTYDGDSSAVAVILADFGTSTISYNQSKGFELKFERTKRIKILKKEGYDWANMTIPLFKRDNIDEKLSGLKAVTLNWENNKVVESKLEKDGIFTEAVNQNWDYIKLTFPNVKVGSVIDVTYKTISPYLFNFQDWEFQSTIPVKWSEYRAQIPEYYEYQKFAQGYVPFKINEQSAMKRTITLSSKQRASGIDVSATTFSSHNIDYMENQFRWVAEGVAAFKVEPYMTTYRDYISKLNFELALIKIPGEPIQTVMGTWENINKELMDATNFGGVVKRSAYLKKTVDEITQGKIEEADKLAAIFNFVRSNVEWDGNYRLFSESDFKNVLESKKGSSAEINLLLVSMLQKAGMKADPVVLSTRDHGFVRQQFPLSSQFNYVICAANMKGKLLLLDATDRSLPIQMLPERCLNGSGFLISETQPGWIDLVPSVKSRIVTDATLVINDDGDMKASIKYSREGYDGQKMRLEFHSKGEEDYLKGVRERNGWTIHSGKFENLENPNSPVAEIYELSIPSDNGGMADIIYISPLIGNDITDNPFKSEKREYPVDFGSPFERTNLIKLKVPEGYQVEDIPKPLAIALPNGGGRFVYSVNNLNGLVSITTQFIISKSLFNQMEYENLREFYAQVVAKNDEQIVIKKSN